jgi:hypothetical protein
VCLGQERRQVDARLLPVLQEERVEAAEIAGCIVGRVLRQLRDGADDQPGDLVPAQLIAGGST